MEVFVLSVFGLAGVVFLIYVGRFVAVAKMAAEQDDVEVQRHELESEWFVLEQARKVNDVFLRAHDAMRQAENEAGDYGSGRPPRPAPPVVDGRWER
jgi:hypothetical protein